MELRVMSLMIVVACVESLFLSEDRIDIHPPQPSSLMVRQGDNVTLTCSATQPWFLCLWVHPSGDKLCSIQEDGDHSTVCQGVPGAELIVSGHSCHVLLTSVSEEDAGDWMCLLSQTGVYHTDREITHLEVATPASASLRVETNDLEDTADQESVEMVEEETVTMVCESGGGFPAPQFTWYLVQEEMVDGVLEESVEVLEEATIIKSDENNNSRYHTSSITYTASLLDHGKSLRCSTHQRDIFTDQTLFNISSSKTLSVSAKPSPLHAYLSQQQDVVAGVVISCCLIIFCVIIVIIFSIRSNKAVTAPKKLMEETRAHESYIIFLEEPVSESNSSNNSNNTSREQCSSERDDKSAESGIDVSQGDFVSFSSDLYKTNTDHHQMIGDISHLQTSDDHQDESSDGCGASEGGLSNISVFDCQHGCFHDQHDHHHHHLDHHHYYRDSVLNTDL